ncbi:transposase [Nostoc sp. C110]|uniref:transposase n=1 Tax=Nostoc sp. C110 TaxID=3349876 RepID=UPI00370D9B34
MIINSFPEIVKGILRGLPKNDYPVLNSRLFFECWLSYALDNSLTSMRDLFKRLNNTGFDVDISTFSKANSHRSQKTFQEVYQKLNEVVQNNWKLEFDDVTGLIKVGASDDAQAYRVINFCDLETKTEFRLVTNLPESGDAAVDDDEIRDIYRLRWGVELLWKFLKMHLKLDKLITKNVNGITIQIYVSLIAYLILQLVSIPAQWGYTLLDKFRYLQSCMCQKISYVHWFEEMIFC